MRSGKGMGEEDTEVLLSQGARKAGGERRERGQSKGERQIDVQGLRESTAGSQRCFKGWHSQGQRLVIKLSIHMRRRRWKRLRKSRPQNLQLCSRRD